MARRARSLRFVQRVWGVGESGGAGGIRTLDTVLPYTHFPGERLRPLGHRSACSGRRRSNDAPASGQGAVIRREGLGSLRSPVSAALSRGSGSNPRYGFAVYSLSRRAPSTTRPPLRMLWKAAI